MDHEEVASVRRPRTDFDPEKNCLAMIVLATVLPNVGAENM